ncbi:unnamed protein product [Blepharisma stoltei]|uniref:STIL N-terminal domain-containing protein n=1 Tax=Blepharisma stoltei TaxID=1481888 RepID=A0AAU9J381_9CILI|nr:unnamed protein product [Blepharisma stoltei]
MERFSEYQENSYSRNISLQASISELWSRQPQDKRLVLRIQSMLPQFKLTSDVLRCLWEYSIDPDPQFTGVITAFKYSPLHFLSLKATEIVWLRKGENLPQADYLMHLSPQSVDSAENLQIEEKIFDSMMRSAMRRIERNQELEPLDVCRACIAFTADETTQRLLMKCEILFPAVSLQFTPILPLKLVSTPLSSKLTKGLASKYQAGYLTLDQSGRALPLLDTDPLAMQYPIVGIWVTGIPESQSNRNAPIIHPLVWTSCIQYIESKNIRDKISPDPENLTMLFVHFAGKPKFYEISCVGNPQWRTESFCSEIPREEESYFAPCFATFLKEDQTVNSIELSMDNFPRHSVNSSISYGSRISTPSNYQMKPPRQSGNPGMFTPSYSRQLSRKNSMESLRGSGTFSPSAEQIIEDQSKMLAQLQAQIKELQAHVFKPKIQNNIGGDLVNAGTNTTFNTKDMREMSNAETNTTFVTTAPAEYLTMGDLRVSEEGMPSMKNTSMISSKSNANKPPCSGKSMTSRPVSKPLSSSSEDHNESNGPLEYNPLRYSSMEFQDSPGPSPHPYKSKISQSPSMRSKQNSMDLPYTDRSSVSSIKMSDMKLKFSVESSTDMPINYQRKLAYSPANTTKPVNEVAPSDQTICVPKIMYESSSEGSDDDNVLTAIEKKYLR